MAIQRGLNLPERTRIRSSRAAMYEFDELKVGDSFFVPKPAKIFSGRVSIENRKHSEGTGEYKAWGEREREVRVQKKHFRVFPVEAGQEYDSGFVEPETGCRVFRVL